MGNVYATWNLDDNRDYRGIVVDTKEFDTVMRTDHAYTTPEAATVAARALIDSLVAA